MKRFSVVGLLFVFACAKSSSGEGGPEFGAASESLRELRWRSAGVSLSAPIPFFGTAPTLVAYSHTLADFRAGYVGYVAAFNAVAAAAR